VSIPKKDVCYLPNIRHSATNRIELVKRRFAPRLLSEQNSFELNTHSTPISCVLTKRRTEGENKPSDNRAAQPKQEIQSTVLKAADKASCELAMRGLMFTEIAKDAKFRDGIELWLDSRTFGNGSQRHRYIAPRTLKDYRQYKKPLNTFFGDLEISAIHAGYLREYQRIRAEEVGPNKINQEMGVVVRVIKSAGAWTQEHERFYEPLQRIESDIPKALTPDEQQLWLDAASSSEQWKLVYCYSLVGLSTCMASNEERGLEIGGTNTRDRIVNVKWHSAKNRTRMRTIPLNDEACWGMGWLLHRAKGLGATAPQHFVFPFRVNFNLWDPCKHMTEWAIIKKWNEVREASGLKDFSPNHLRHTACTRYAEAGMPIHVLMSYAGHISPRMQQHYIFISQQAQRFWQARERELKTERFGPQSFPQKSYVNHGS
jgi:integrase